MKELSAEFENAIVDSGSLVIDCEFCGKTHFASYDAHFYEEGELETLREKAKETPNKYIEHDYSSVSWGYFAGKQAVIDCDCEQLIKWENMIWDNKYIITKYLLARNKRELEEKQHQNKEIVKLVEL